MEGKGQCRPSGASRQPQPNRGPLAKEQRALPVEAVEPLRAPTSPLHRRQIPQHSSAQRRGAACRDTLLSPCSSEWEVFSFLLDMVHVDAERLESLPSQRWAFSCTLSSADSEGEAGRELS